MNCNLEGNWPPDTYYCNSSDCIPVPPLPPLDEWPRNVTKSFYFLSPVLFGLTYPQEFGNFLVTVFTSTHLSTAPLCKLCNAVPCDYLTANLAQSTFPPTPRPSPGPGPGAIAGAAVGAVVGFLAIVGLLTFFLLRRRRQKRHDKAAEADHHPQVEKAQLHSDDLKRDRKELVGESEIKRKPVPVAEMPANEDPERIASELPVNEIVGSEMDSPSKNASTAAGTGST
jgi:hypothetical protein